MLSPAWRRPLRAGHQALRVDLLWIAAWALALGVALGINLAVDLPAWILQVAALGTALQTLGTLSGLVLRDPRPEDYHDHKYLG